MNIIEQIQEKLASKILKFYKHNKKRYYIDISPGDIVEVSKILFQQLGLRFAIATGTDTPKGLEILYHFSFDKSGEMVSIRVLITDKTHPEIESISSVIKMAEWIEREMWEMLGIKFKNHPNLKRLLLADSWPEGVYPMRQGT